MKILTHKRTGNDAGFTRVELLTAAVTLSMILVFHMLDTLREKVHVARCRDNLRKIYSALQTYAQDNSGKLPDCSVGPFGGRTWPWELNASLVDVLQSNGVPRASLYCPSNPGMNDGHHWDFNSQEESRVTRVLGYSFLLNGIDSAPSEVRCTTLQGNDGRAASNTELITDAVVCVSGNTRANDPVQRALSEDYINREGLWKGRTSHLAGLFGKLRPAGGNIAFADGHVAWRDFYEMHHRFRTGNITWDF